MKKKTTKKGSRDYERVTRLCSGYSISKRAPLDPVEIKRIQEAIKEGVVADPTK